MDVCLIITECPSMNRSCVNVGCGCGVQTCIGTYTVVCGADGATYRKNGELEEAASSMISSAALMRLIRLAMCDKYQTLDIYLFQQ